MSLRMSSCRFFILGALVGGLACTLAMVGLVRSQAADHHFRTFLAKFVGLPGNLLPTSFAVGLSPVQAAQTAQKAQPTRVIVGQTWNGNAEASVGDQLVNEHSGGSPIKTMHKLRKAKVESGAGSMVGAEAPRDSRELKLGTGVFGLCIFGVLLYSLIQKLFRKTQTSHACNLLSETSVSFPSGAMAEMQPAALELASDLAICSDKSRQQRVDVDHGRFVMGSFASNLLLDTDASLIPEEDVPKNNGFQPWTVANAFSPASAFTARTCMMRVPAPRAVLGFQADPSAIGTVTSIVGGFTALHLKFRAEILAREARDAAVEALRVAEAQLLGGRASLEDVQQATAAAQQAVQKYEEARSIISIAGVQLRMPDHEPPRKLRLLDERLTQSESQPSPPPPAAAPTPDVLDPLRERLGLRNPDAPPAEGGSLLPSGEASITLKDVTIFATLLAQINFLLFALTDPRGAPTPALGAELTVATEVVDGRGACSAEVAAEYEAMLMKAAVESGEAPPTSAKLSELKGGCSGVDLTEFWGTRGVDSSRGGIFPPP